MFDYLKEDEQVFVQQSTFVIYLLITFLCSPKLK